MLILPAAATVASAAPAPISFGGGKLRYQPDRNGDMIPDFSYCGYMAGEKPIPDAPVRITLTPDPSRKRDERPQIQEAIDRLAKMPPDANGIRGVILLKKGDYRINGQLKIETGGIVLRGEGNEYRKGTRLIAGGKDKRDLIIVGTPKWRPSLLDPVDITEDVPWGSRVIRVASTAGFKPGQSVYVQCDYDQAWIKTLGMDKLPPRKNGGKVQNWGPFSLKFDRVIKAVNPAAGSIEVDAPIGCRITKRNGGGRVVGWRHDRRIQQVGIENIRLSSNYDRNTRTKVRGRITAIDENHCDRLVVFEAAANCWMRKCSMANGINGVTLGSASKWVTLRDCRVDGFVSLISGGRRYGFNLTGSLALVIRCHVKGGRHAYAVNSRVPGPNAFVQCTSEGSWESSEPHHRWSVSGLYDNVQDNIAIQNRVNMGSGHGWAGAYYVVWNCRGDLICQSPPTAVNYVFGHTAGKMSPGAFGRTAAERRRFKIRSGRFHSNGRQVQPKSLFLQQFKERLGADKLKHLTR